MAESTPKSYSSDPALYLYTSLTSGSSHIVTATSRLETILKANKIPFKALDIATDEKARMLWGRRSGKDESGRARKIPGLVQMGLVVGDLVEIEEWNEYGELKQHITIYHEGGAPTNSAAPTPSGTPSKAPVLPKNNKPEPVAAAESSKDAESKPAAGAQPSSFTLAMRQVGEEAAQKAKEAKQKVTETFTGVGEAEPEKEDAEKDNSTAVRPPPSISLTEPLSGNHNIDTPTNQQSSTSIALGHTPDSIRIASYSVDEMENLQRGSLQSPNSTSWKPTDINPPILVHRGSSVSSASAECIKQIEDEATIPEEDEEDAEEVKD